MTSPIKYSYPKIYGLYCPTTGELKYIGKTKRYLSDRLYRHMHPFACENSAKVQWITSLKIKGLKPEIKLIEIVKDGANPAIREMFWIAQYNNLLNTTEVRLPLSKYVAKSA